MKVSRWKIIYATFGEIITSLFLKIMIIVILYMIVLGIDKIIHIRGSVKISYIGGIIVLLIGAILFIGASWGKFYLLDIILMNVQETSLLPASELEYGDALYSLLSLAEETGIDSEEALRKVLKKYQDRIDKNKSMGSGN